MQVTLIKEWRDAITEVSDQQSLVTSLRQSPYFVMFQDQIDGWDRRLNTLQEGLSMMSSVQRKWLYLEPIFARGALAEHAQRFRQVWWD
jgi:dynein heavy chain 2